MTGQGVSMSGFNLGLKFSSETKLNVVHIWKNKRWSLDTILTALYSSHLDEISSLNLLSRLSIFQAHTTDVSVADPKQYEINHHV